MNNNKILIKRKLEKKIEKSLFKNKAIIITGPRQSGKTTLVKQIVKNIDQKYIWLNGDEPDVRSDFKDITSTELKSIVGDNKLLIIDEAQRIENIGITIKLIVDNLDIQVIATGSSSFELANRIKEPLTGRKIEFIMLPISFEESAEHTSRGEEKRLLEQRLLFGCYPEVIVQPDRRLDYLKEISDSYLYKDILVWQKIKKPEKLEKLIQALALQIGNEVSYNELAGTVGLDNETVENYISVLEKAFIVFRLPSLSRNVRTELKKKRKIFFYDNGIRNAVLNNFKSIDLRNDKGNLFENYLVSERLKFLFFNGINANRFFWRTKEQSEIDYIEERDGILNAYEFKMTKERINIPGSFVKNYPQSRFNLITKKTYDKFLIQKKF